MTLRDHYRTLLAGEPLLDLTEAEPPSVFSGLRSSRSRMGQFRSMDARLAGLKPGDQMNLLKIVTAGSLPGVQSARLFKADLGYIVSVNHGQDIFERHHQGDMGRDDLVEYLTQIREEIVRTREARTKGDRVETIRQVKVTKAADEGKVKVE